MGKEPLAGITRPIYYSLSVVGQALPALPAARHVAGQRRSASAWQPTFYATTPAHAYHFHAIIIIRTRGEPRMAWANAFQKKLSRRTTPAIEAHGAQAPGVRRAAEGSTARASSLLSCLCAASSCTRTLPSRFRRNRTPLHYARCAPGTAHARTQDISLYAHLLPRLHAPPCATLTKAGMDA